MARVQTLSKPENSDQRKDTMGKPTHPFKNLSHRVYRLPPPMEVLLFFLQRTLPARLDAKKNGRHLSKMPPKQP
ncbi:uncharacterized protein METZ01_LOCUS189477 [marine metagenome]|uniref:Uncharacterized protein n=1 Tax=marine metagenome TaxID=408172 RepID=A0A382DG88_9ZZZZ